MDWRESTLEKVLSWYMANPDWIPDSPYVPLSPPRMILHTEPGESPEDYQKKKFLSTGKIIFINSFTPEWYIRNIPIQAAAKAERRH